MLFVYILPAGAQKTYTFQHQRPPAEHSKPNAPKKKMAGWTGLEPAISSVTGRRPNQLDHHPKNIFFSQIIIYSKYFYFQQKNKSPTKSMNLIFYSIQMLLQEDLFRGFFLG